MTTVKRESDPLSIEQIVKRRVEKRHSGVSVSTPSVSLKTERKHTVEPHRKTVDKHEPDLANQFLSLLLPIQSSATEQVFEDMSVEKENSTSAGTNSFFSPLNKQEESVNKTSNERKPFELCIENSSLGTLQLRGTWCNGKLLVHLQISKPLDMQQRKALAIILSKRLSHELDVQMEIEID